MSDLEKLLKNLIKEAVVEALDERTPLETATIKSEGAIEPGTSRKKKNKADAIKNEVEQGFEVVEEPVLPSAEPAPIEYKTLQMAVVKLVKTKGKEPAIKILEQFGVATALELKPSQYAEALEMFEEAAA